MRHLNATEHKRKKRGQATVELALGMIFLVLLLVGVADVARIYSEQLDVVHAAGVAARWKTLTGTQQYCSSHGNTSAEGIATVVARDLGQPLATEVTGITVETPVAVDAPAVTVKVAYHHEFLFGIVQGVSSSFTGASTMPGVPSELQIDPNCPAGVTPGPLPTSTNTPIPTNTPTITPIPTNTPTNTPTITPIATNTPTFTNTPTITPNAQTQTAVVVATQTAAAGATQTAGVQATQTAGAQATQTAAAGATQTAGVQATQTAVADFAISASPTSITIPKGSSGTSTITVTSLGGFSGSVGLTAVVPNPGNKVQASVSPASVIVTPSTPGSSTLTITVASNASSGTYTVTVTGTAGAKSHTTTVTLTVP